MSPDPLTIHGMGADPNPYAYVGGRTLSAVDPLGLDVNVTKTTGEDGQPIYTMPFSRTFPPPEKDEPLLPGDPVYGESGVRMGAPMPVRNFVAQGYQQGGHFNLAEIAEAGHGCALCHIIKEHRTLGEANAAIDLKYYNNVAVGLSQMRDMLLTAIVMEGAALSSALRTAGAAEGVALSSRSTGPAFDAAKLARIQSNLEAEGKGVKFTYDASRLAPGAEAQYIAPPNGGPGEIIFRPNPSRAAVIEELTHFGQHRATGFARGWPGTPVELRTLEMSTQVRLLNLRTVAWTAQERADLMGAWNWWRVNCP